jgi:NAD(P)-dependent dehydrogenase (short-subunit alcohol dehydrogenase family)
MSPKSEHDMQGRTVLIVRATVGIGYETAQLLARRGASVLDELSAAQRPRWTLVDAAWTPNPAASATVDNGNVS